MVTVCRLHELARLQATARRLGVQLQVGARGCSLLPHAVYYCLCYSVRMQLGAKGLLGHRGMELLTYGTL